jgi:hypothetical protein
MFEWQIASGVAVAYMRKDRRNRLSHQLLASGGEESHDIVV